MKVNEEILSVLNSMQSGTPYPEGTTDVDDKVFIDTLAHLWSHYNYSIDLCDETDVDDCGIRIDKMLGTDMFYKR